MKRIVERDQQLLSQYKKSMAGRQNVLKLMNEIDGQMQAIRFSSAPKQRKTAALTIEGNRMNNAKDKFDRHDRQAGKWKKIIIGSETFGAQVLGAVRGNPVNYRLYLRSDIDGSQIDIYLSTQEGLASNQLERGFLSRSLAIATANRSLLWIAIPN